MPIRKIKYKLEIPVGLSFDRMRFDNNITLHPSDLEPTDETGVFEDTLSDQIITEGGKLRVIVHVSGQNGLQWSLQVWVGSKALNDNPITESASGGRADHDEIHSYDE
ncbi:hypothetical protein QQ008_07335 [Fulvivirgaceae bacterium BMA10]|uniref:Uncharacterized protein n=1 Tax=Splendidivirga corallicola TaxID=3051826 RepID=A0ABT8KMB2_9BACT|nr:hypothetical protein [Fulvivirgaceae bacterium BMA10]